MLKPHRVLARRVGLYADEAGAFLRRRRQNRREFLRLTCRDGTGQELPVTDPRAAAAVAAARELLEK